MVVVGGEVAPFWLTVAGLGTERIVGIGPAIGSVLLAALGYLIVANDSSDAQAIKRQADLLGKIAGEGCKGKTAFYQGTTKDLPQPKGDRRPQLPVPPEHQNDTFF